MNVTGTVKLMFSDLICFMYTEINMPLLNTCILAGIKMVLATILVFTFGENIFLCSVAFVFKGCFILCIS